MAKIEQALTLDPPNELHFKGPYSEVTSSRLKLTNPTDRRIAFKVKTTAPKTYCVRPNGGVIDPKKDVSVAVMLQPCDPENDDRSRDKFMVQSVFVQDGEEYTDSLWHDTPPEGLMNSKLKCIFNLPGDTTDNPVGVVNPPKAKAKVVPVQETKPSDVEAENRKLLYEEYKKLKSDLSELRVENSALKEEGLRSRVAYDTRTRITSAKPEPESPLHLAAKKQFSSNYLLVIGILIFLLGLYIGKSVL